MDAWIAVLETLELPAFFALIALPLLVVGSVVAAVRNWDALKQIIRNRLTHRAEYEKLQRLQTGLDREHVESEGLFGPPPLTSSAWGKYTITLYAESEYFLKVVYDQRDKIGMYSVTVRDPNFKPRFRVAADEFRLGEVTYADFPAEQILYATYSSKDVRYAESCYLANPGGYQDLLLATHWPPGTRWDSGESKPNIVSLCHELGLTADQYRHGLMQDEMIAAVREEAKPNCFGFASMGFDKAGTVAVGAVYQHVRPLLRQG